MRRKGLRLVRYFAVEDPNRAMRRLMAVEGSAEVCARSGYGGSSLHFVAAANTPGAVAAAAAAAAAGAEQCDAMRGPHSGRGGGPVPLLQRC